MDSITLTFGEQALTHVGMDLIGNQMSTTGFTLEDLLFAKNNFESIGCTCEIVNLRNQVSDLSIRALLDDAYILIIHNAVNKILEDINKNTNDLYNEQRVLDVDKKAKMRGRIVNKLARYNLCFSNFNQEPDYENNKGRILSFDSVPLTNHVRNKLSSLIGDKASHLHAEGNYYYDADKCGIGFHGDAERKKVIAIRLGPRFIPLKFLWFHKNKYINTDSYISNLESGSMYILSEKATGFDWKKKNLYTLRHAAGAGKYISLPVSYTINY